MDISIIKTISDINERLSVIKNYDLTRLIDRDYAIKLIMDKRKEDPSVAEATAIEQMGKVLLPLEEVPSEILVHELQLQVATMEVEVLDKINN